MLEKVQRSASEASAAKYE